VKPIRAGELNRRIRIERREEVDDDTGDPVPIEPWPLFAEVWGALEPGRGRELVLEQELVAEVDARIRIRFLPGVTAKMRAHVYPILQTVPKIQYAHTFDIVAVLDQLDRRREMHLLVKEGVNDG
jgi:SPP1 family predicted phage head-tail adaptor